MFTYCAESTDIRPRRPRSVAVVPPGLAGIVRDPDLASRLLHIVRTARDRGHCCFTPGDFCYRWQTETGEEVPPDIHIWQDEQGQDTGFAWRSGDDLHIVTRAESEALRASMLAWGEDRHLASGSERSLRIPIDNSSPDWQALLEHHGYRPGEPELVLRSQALETITVLPPPGDGYLITHVQSQAHLDGWAAAYQAAFAPEAMPGSVRRAIGRSALYRPDLDLIACDAGGAVVAFALAWFDPASATGAFEPLGCVPAHQRRGLSRALMTEGFLRLKRLGARRAFVTTTRGRLAANRLYESTGFQVESTSRTWSQPGV